MSRARRLLLVVDAPSLLHRNHHARAHTRLTDRQGRPIRALQGMLRHIFESIDTIAPAGPGPSLGGGVSRARSAW